MALLYLAPVLWGVVLGLVLSIFTPRYRTMKLRLKNINEVSEDALNGRIGHEDAILFITCESNLNLRERV